MSTTTTDVTFRVSGQAWSVISGSELSMDPVKYDGGSRGARDAFAALTDARSVRAGRGFSLIVTASRDGADVIRRYCETVGSTWIGEPDPETRADARALLKVAARIAELNG